MSDARAYVKRLRPSTATATLVLWAIADYADENGDAQPSLKRLVADTGRPQRTVSAAIESLLNDGLIERRRAYSDTGRIPDVITLVGFAKWRDEVDAISAPKNGSQVQKLQVQKWRLTKPQAPKLQVQKLPLSPDMGGKIEADTKSGLGAKMAPNGHIVDISTTVGNYPRSESDLPLLVPIGTMSAPNADALPKRKKGAAKSARLSDPSPAFLALWDLWLERDLIRRSRRKPAWEAYQLAIRKGAHVAEIEAGMRAYLAAPEKTKDGGQFMPALKVWLGDETWREWLNETTRPKVDWGLRLNYFREHGKWFDRWGPRPDEDGYLGPALA